MSSDRVRLLVAEVLGEPVDYWLLFDDYAAAWQYADQMSESLWEPVRIRVVGHASWPRGLEPSRLHNFLPGAFDRARLRRCRPRVIVGEVPPLPFYHCVDCD